MRSCVVLSTMLCCLHSLAGFSADTPPGPPEPDYPQIDRFAYPDDAAAHQAWAPMSGSQSVSLTPIDGRNALRMPCNFAGTDIERASWDRAVELDLAAAQGVQFRFYCPDITPVSHFCVYFQSGGGWYASTLSGMVPGEWSTIRIKKSQTGIEQKPDGWGRIRTIRVSAWRLKDEDTEFYIADFGVLGGDAPIAVVRAESATREAHNEARAAQQCAQAAAGYLEDLGLAYAPMSDLDVTLERLEGKQLVILPYSPCVPDGMVEVLAEYLRRGGKLIAFYVLPSELLPEVGMQHGEYFRPEQPGYFASIRPSEQGLKGLPAVVSQASHNIREARPVEGKSWVAAYWHNEAGASTGRAAIVASANCVFMTHIMLTDDPEHKRLLFLAMIGHLLPDCWQQVAQARVADIGAIGPYENFEEARRAIKQAARTDVARREIAQVAELHSKARGLLEQGRFPEAIATAVDARQHLRRAYCAAQRPQKGEHRAFWCHSAFGVEGMKWDEAIRNLAENGFTAILPNMLWGGAAYTRAMSCPWRRRYRSAATRFRHAWRRAESMASSATCGK